MKFNALYKKAKHLWIEKVLRFDREKLKVSPRVFTFSFFVVLSTVLWFLNALSREYADEITFPVRYDNYPEGLVLLNEPPSRLKLSVEAYGYSLFYHMITPSIVPLQIDFSQTPMRVLKEGDTLSYFIETGYLQNEIAGQLNSEIKLKDAKPDSLIFTFTKTISKKVPVSFQQRIGLKKPFQIKGEIKLSPDSVWIEGPQAIIQNMDFVSSENVELTGLDANYEGNVRLRTIDYVKFSEEEITVNIEVEKYTETNVQVEFLIKNLPDTLSLKVFPDFVRINYLVGLEEYQKISKDDFAAELDYEDVKTAISNKIPVRITKKADAATMVNYFPKQVEFILKKKHSNRDF